MQKELKEDRGYNTCSKSNAESYEHLLNKICYGRLFNGKTFLAELIEIYGNKLIFRTKSGRIIINRAENIKLLAEIPQRKSLSEVVVK